MQSRPLSKGCDVGGACRARRSQSFPWPDEEKEQDGREGDHECGAHHRRGCFVEEIGQDILENVESPTKKSDHDKSSTPPKVWTSPPRTTKDLETRTLEACWMIAPCMRQSFEDSR